ncbi:MAG: polysaccharide deacetylase family protein [Bacteroidota bacterium]|nr:polysaccharide deacetylase family protein [Bacteroidota bacterium]
MYQLGIGNFFLNSNRKKNLVPILVFHKIIPEYDEIWPGIHPKLFEEILVLIKKHYTILPINDLFFKPISELKNACFITFDDGYKDYLDYAYPILKKHQVPSSLFVLPYQITNKGHIWTSAISFFIKHYSVSEVDDFLKKRNILINYSNKLNPFKFNLDITVFLCAMTHAERSVIIKDLREKFVLDNRVIENELLTFDQLRLLDPELSNIGSHSLTHPSFKMESNKEFIQREIEESKEIIEREINMKVKSFAFPFANSNEVSINFVKKLYDLCFTRINDLVDLNKIKKDKNYYYDLPRIGVYHNSAEEVFFLMNGFHKKLGK